MTAAEAKDYGIIDEVISARASWPTAAAPIAAVSS